jgi:hypothetical protein
MEQVQRAALAPGSPSGQDLSVAGRAAAAAAQARQEAASKGHDADEGKSESDTTFKSGAASVQAGRRFGRIQSGEETEGVSRLPDLFSEPKDAYARNASQHGLWTWGRGFESIPSGRKDPWFDFAA